MIRVVLADDDYLIKDVIADVVPWQALGMELLDFAEDGQQALEMCLQYRPDILITDIRMPLLSGLEVAMHLAENDLTTKVILISGAQDFDYARTALDLHVAGYLLKPIRMKEVIATLKKVRESIDAERNRDAVLSRIQKRLEENIPLALDKFLCNLVRGEATATDGLHDRLQYFGLPLHEEQDFVVAVAQIDNYTQLAATQSEQNLQMLNFTIRDIISQAMENYQSGVSVVPRDNEFVCIFTQEYCAFSQMESVLESIRDLAEELTLATLTFGIGLQVTGLRSAHISYRGGIKALDYKFYMGSRSMIQISDVSRSGLYNSAVSSECNSTLHTLRKELLRLGKLGDAEGVQAALEQYFVLLTPPGTLSQEYVRGQFLEIVIHVYRDFCETEGEQEQMYSCYNAAVQNILRAETAVQVKQHTCTLLIYVVQYFSNKYSSRNQQLVERIKGYIDANYMHSLALTDIASAVFMSPNYICAVFKNETGHTINEYLLAVKMHEAKKLLRNSSMKILEIAEQLGYETSHYFSYSFKHYVGKTPQQYRSGSHSA